MDRKYFLITQFILLSFAVPIQATETFTDDFDIPHDFIVNGVIGTEWDGLIGLREGETVDVLNANITNVVSPGANDETSALYVQSTGSNWDTCNPMGPLLYRMVSGDFIAIVEVVDFAGCWGSSRVADNDCGIMVRVPHPADAGSGEDHLTMNYFPTWPTFIGRDVDNGEEYEFGQIWEGCKYDGAWIQLEREGNHFHFYGGNDTTWTQLTESPRERVDLAGLDLQVGLMHSMYTSNTGYAAFDNFYLHVLDEFPPMPYAHSPMPFDGQTSVDSQTELRWKAGDFVQDINGHELYISTNFNDVSNGNPAVKIVLTDANYLPESGHFAFGQTYYWAVDEVNDPCIWEGDVWQFTVRDYSLMDDFESYSSTGKSRPPPAGTLKSVWVDGNYGFSFFPPAPGTSGSLVQLNTDTYDGEEDYPHYQPEDIAQSGAKSIKFYYDNDGIVTWEVDLYGAYPPELFSYTPNPDEYLSEVYAAIDDVAAGPNLDSLDLKRDWSIYKVLKLSFYGDTNNGIEPMYAGLEDGSGNLAVIYHPDSKCIINSSWQNWHIALQDFVDINDVNLTDIAKIHIGFGNKYNQQPGGTGLIFIDDIQLLTYGICIPENAPAGDLNDDCKVNYVDLKIMAEEWLTAGIKADIIDNDNVDGIDFTVMANDWLKEVLLGE